MSECEYNEIIINPPEQPVDTEYVPAPSEPGSRGQALLSDGEGETYWGDLSDMFVSVPAEIKFDNTNVSHTFTEGPNKVEMSITKITLVNPKTGSNLTLDSSTTALIYNDIFPTFYRVKYIPVINDPSMEKGPIYNDQWQYSKLCHSINIKPATSAASNPGLKGNYCFYVFFAPNYEEINPNQTRAQQLAGMALPIAANATLLVKRSLFD